MFRQSKKESNSTDQLAIIMNTAQHNKIYNYHKIATLARQMSRLRGFSLEAGSLLSRAGRFKVNICSTMLRLSCTPKQKENVNKNVKSKPFPFPGNGAKNLIEAELALKNV